MKVTDKSKIYEVKASIEATIKLPAVQGGGHIDYSDTHDKISKNTETTVAINWSGGGSIKDPEEGWTVDSITKVAAAFPDLVAITPQRTYAILTKYTALESFQRQQANFSPLDYENAGIYTASLLDHYMDYKMIWKQLNQATYELENNRATIEWSHISEQMYELARVKPLPQEQRNAKLQGQLMDSRNEYADENMPKESDEWDPKLQEEIRRARLEANQIIANARSYENVVHSHIKSFQNLVASSLGLADDGKVQLPLFRDDFSGLINARKVCRVEMAKIVNEVDLVTKDPTYALDPERDAYFLHPLVFKQMLPVSDLIRLDRDED
jgi:hypothetical protein